VHETQAAASRMRPSFFMRGFCHRNPRRDYACHAREAAPRGWLAFPIRDITGYERVGLVLNRRETFTRLNESVPRRTTIRSTE
jgi:hypothetical protein